MNINVTIHETTKLTDYVVCSILSLTGNLLASQYIPPPTTSPVLMSFTGLSSAPSWIVEIMFSPDGTRQNGKIWTIGGRISMGIINLFQNTRDLHIYTGL